MKELPAHHLTMPGLVALFPLLLVINSIRQGFAVAIMVSILLLLPGLLYYFLSRLVPAHLRLFGILIINVSIVCSVKMILMAHAYSFTRDLDVFFPLLIMNTMLMSIHNHVFSINDFSLILRTLTVTCLCLLSFFCAFAFIRELFSGVALFGSAAGSLLLLGCLFGFFNWVKTHWRGAGIVGLE